MSDPSFWPFWVGALCLGGLVALTWALERRLIAGSGSITRVTTALSDGDWGAADEKLLNDQDALQAALMAATLAEFGEQPDVAAPAAPTPPAQPSSWAPAYAHLVFLMMIGVGGLLSALQTGTFNADWSLGTSFNEIMGAGPVMIGYLVLGGLAVGFGTRMASGCTTGHGLCGVSRFQVGSFVATGAFFGTGIAVSYLIEFLT